MTAVQLRDRLNTATGLQMPASLAYDHPTLGPVRQIKESPPPPPDARPMRLLAAEAAPTPPATEPGETTIWAAVTVTWVLVPHPDAEPG